MILPLERIVDLRCVAWRTYESRRGASRVWRYVMATVFILVSLAIFVVLLLGSLNRFVKRLQTQQMAGLWNACERWRDPKGWDPPERLRLTSGHRLRRPPHTGGRRDRRGGTRDGKAACCRRPLPHDPLGQVVGHDPEPITCYGRRVTLAVSGSDPWPAQPYDLMVSGAGLRLAPFRMSRPVRLV